MNANETQPPDCICYRDALPPEMLVALKTYIDSRGSAGIFGIMADVLKQPDPLWKAVEDANKVPVQ